MSKYIDIRLGDDLVGATLNKIIDDTLYLTLANGDEGMLDICEGTQSCCNYGNGTITDYNDVLFPALITKVVASPSSETEDYNKYVITLYGARV
jgi:hypothetical protein